ncbi:EthD family reductase [Azospirillum canadense]|uniref:EthD family reductase n=1 Tax=Azospirillum canadense TaxID=403962 RepID=UPI002226C3AC|nr:EthD family reductase [Azospirillum canadense]MCW2243011.1 uncharacterized protein (TIGR02118 family) [Azospirillum canadense]
MIKITIQYPNKDGARFDIDYYVSTHMPMAIEKLGPGVRGVTVEHGISGALPGSAPAFVASCSFLFDTADAFYEAFLPNAAQLQGDIPNYTDIEPVIHFSEVKLSQ